MIIKYSRFITIYRVNAEEVDRLINRILEEEKIQGEDANRGQKTDIIIVIKSHR